MAQILKCYLFTLISTQYIPLVTDIVESSHLSVDFRYKTRFNFRTSFKTSIQLTLQRPTSTSFNLTLTQQIFKDPNRPKWGCSHSSVDSSASTILLIWVQVPSTPSTLLSFMEFVLYLTCEKNKNKQKEAGLGPFFKNRPKCWFEVLKHTSPQLVAIH